MPGRIELRSRRCWWTPLVHRPAHLVFRVNVFESWGEFVIKFTFEVVLFCFFFVVFLKCVHSWPLTVFPSLLPASSSIASSSEVGVSGIEVSMSISLSRVGSKSAGTSLVVSSRGLATRLRWSLAVLSINSLLRKTSTNHMSQFAAEMTFDVLVGVVRVGLPSVDCLYNRFLIWLIFLQVGECDRGDSVGGNWLVGVGGMDDEGVPVDLLGAVEEVGVSPGVVVVGDLDLRCEVTVSKAHDEPFLKVVILLRISDCRVSSYKKFSAAGVPLEEVFVGFPV